MSAQSRSLPCLLAVAVCLAVTTPSVVAIEVGTQKQLFVDDYVVAEKQNVTRELGEVEKHGVVVKPSVPTDFHPTDPFAGGLPKASPGFGYRLAVVRDDKQEKFQMWYRSCGERWTSYAESRDGIGWIKPKVSRDGAGNLITYRGRTGNTFYETTVTVDPTVSWGHPEKYKAAFNPGNTRCAIAHSSDGIRWTGYNGGQSVTGRAADTQNQILWDPIGRRYLLLTRTDLGAQGGIGEVRATRIMAHSENNDLLKHPTAWKTLATIRLDQVKHKKTPPGVRALQMEAMNVWPYENVYFGLMHVLKVGDVTGRPRRATERDLQVRHETDAIDTYLATSRDAVNFDLHWVHQNRPLVPRGPDGSFDKDMLHIASEIVTHNDEHWIYYGGFDHRHHIGGGGGNIGLAKLKLDRFIGLAAGEETGTVVTKPFELQGKTLLLNVDAGSGHVKVEILDEEGEPIPGFAGDDAPAREGVDDLRFQPSWNQHTDLSALTGQLVRLRFQLDDARLYAFRVR